MRKNNSELIVIEVAIKAPINIVWRTITDKDEMSNWYFELKEFKAEIGFEFSFYGGKEDRQYLHLCRVTEVEAGMKITYSWRYDGFAGESFVSFELFQESKNTKVRLTHSGLETFTPQNNDFDKSNFVEGWNYIIGTSLKKYIENKMNQ